MVISYCNFLFSTVPSHICFFSTTTPNTLLPCSSSLKFHNQLRYGSSSPFGPINSPGLPTWHQAVPSDFHSGTSASAGRSWENLGFDPVPTDYIYIMKCSEEGNFSGGGLQPFQNIQLNPASCVLNYGQAIIEGLKAYKKQDNSILLFRPEENGLRMSIGADRLCMPAPTIEQFVEAVKVTVLANRRWIPPPDIGFLYIRPILMGSGAVLSLKPAPEFTFLIYVTPVGSYFKEGLKPIDLVVENEVHRTTPGGVGNVKAISNYAAILKALAAAKANGFTDILYLDSVHKRYLEEVSTANIFILKDKTISTPVLRGTVLPGITRKSIIDIASSRGFQHNLLGSKGVLQRKGIGCCVASALLSTYKYTNGSYRRQNGLDSRLEVGREVTVLTCETYYSADSSSIKQRIFWSCICLYQDCDSQFHGKIYHVGDSLDSFQ